MEVPVRFPCWETSAQAQHGFVTITVSASGAVFITQEFGSGGKVVLHAVNAIKDEIARSDQEEERSSSPRHEKLPQNLNENESRLDPRHETTSPSRPSAPHSEALCSSSCETEPSPEVGRDFTLGGHLVTPQAHASDRPDPLPAGPFVTPEASSYSDSWSGGSARPTNGAADTGSGAGGDGKRTVCQIRIALTVVDGEAAQGDGAPDGREARASGRKSSRVKESPDGDADDDGGDPTWDAGPEGSGQLSDIEDKPTVKQEAPGDQSDDGDPDEPVAPRRRRGRPARARTLRKRRQVGQYVCGTCGAQFVTERALLRHHAREHPEEDEHGEPEEPEEHEEPGEGEAEEEPVSCDICNKSFRYNRSLKNHLQIHQKQLMDMETTINTVEGVNKHNCTQCGKKMRSARSLKKHMAAIHRAPPELWPCEICGKTYQSARACKVHQEAHSTEKKYECKVCGTRFQYSSTFTEHKRRCQKTDHQCSHCNMYYRCATTLMKHQRGCGVDNKCDKCGAIYQTKKELRYHVAIKHPRHECHICNKLFSANNALKRHRINHHGERGEFTCETCGKQFMNEKPFLMHQNLHTGEKPVVCEICGKRYRGRRGLRHHMALHENLKFTCSVCGKIFNTKRKVTAHCNLVHNAERNFPCETCGKCFKSKEKLKAHMDIHLGIFRHVCRLCGKAYNNSGALSHHRKSHLPKQQEMPAPPPPAAPPAPPVPPSLPSPPPTQAPLAPAPAPAQPVATTAHPQQPQFPPSPTAQQHHAHSAAHVAAHQMAASAQAVAQAAAAAFFRPTYSEPRWDAARQWDTGVRRGEYH